MKIVREIAKELARTYVFVGDPKHIRDENVKGNRKKKSQKMVNRWAYREF